MKKYTIVSLVLVSVLCSYQLHAADLSYYPDAFQSGVKGALKDDSLKQEIRRVLRLKHKKNSKGNDSLSENCASDLSVSQCYSHVVVGYRKAREVLLGDFYLVKRGNNGYALREVYCSKEMSPEEFPGKKPGPGLIPDEKIVNTEHTWPQSKFSGKFNKEEQKSDMHHLYPTVSEMNSARSSFQFGEVEKDTKTLKCNNSRLGIPRSGTEDVFEPPMEHKGDVARALFYFSVKYELPIASEEEATIRAWHREDPASSTERARNDQIFSQQFSRNPFIDYPELADKISDF